jgi:hypothetical protein
MAEFAIALHWIKRQVAAPAEAIYLLSLARKVPDRHYPTDRHPPPQLHTSKNDKIYVYMYKIYVYIMYILNCRQLRDSNISTSALCLQ